MIDLKETFAVAACFAIGAAISYKMGIIPSFHKAGIYSMFATGGFFTKQCFNAFDSCQKNDVGRKMDTNKLDL